MGNKRGGSYSKRGRGKGSNRGKGRGGRGGRSSAGGRGGGNQSNDIDGFVHTKTINGLNVYSSNRDPRFDQEIDVSTLKLNKRLRKSKLHQLNNMVESNQGDFTQLEELSVNSMMYDGFGGYRKKNRGANSMFSEIGYTRNHRDEFLTKTFRKRPIEFVKSTEVYDPSKELNQKLAQEGDQLSSDAEDVEDVEDVEAFEKMKGTESSDDEILAEIPSDEEIPSVLPDSLVNAGNDREATVHTDDSGDYEPENQSFRPSNTETVVETGDVLAIPKVKKGIIFIDDNEDEEFNISIEEGEEEEEEEEDGYSYDDPYSARNFTTISDDYIDSESEVLESDSGEDDSSDDEKEIQIGDFLGSIKQSKNGAQYIDLPNIKGKRTKGFGLPVHSKGKGFCNEHEDEQLLYSADGDGLNIDEVITTVNRRLYGTIGETKKKKTAETSKESFDCPIPEFGTLEEDFVSFDVTNIVFDNIRVGNTVDDVQYYMIAPDLLELCDYNWVDSGDLKSILMSYGFPEHRFDAFIKYATSHLSRPDESDEELDFDEDDVYISDSSDSDVDGLLGRSNTGSGSRSGSASDSDSRSESEIYEELLEGMDDLLNMHKNSAKHSMTYDPLDIGTKTIKTKGRGKKNVQLEVNTQLSDEVMKHLEDQFKARKERRKEKKSVRVDDRYLFKTYPYFMDTSDMVHELSSFHQDRNREKMIFPPFDYHVYMVLKSMITECKFNHNKMGRGKKEYLVVTKPKKHSYEPNWQRIENIAKKRGICFRMDISLNREEKNEIKRLITGDDVRDRFKSKSKGNFSYKEGDVVGANAREIAADSIGRKLLESMGWKTGDALGPDHNKGIIEPITAVVKKSKTGIQ